LTSDTGVRTERRGPEPASHSPKSERELRRPFRTEDYQFEPHRCFACGELNEHGLQLALHADERGCWTELSLDERFQGWESVAHGGIVATILDEVMAWSVIGRGTWGVTARMQIAFHKPIPTGHPIRAEGHVVEDRRRTLLTEGRLLDRETGAVLATGTGTYMAAPPDRLAILQARYKLRSADDAPRGTGEAAR
jgi:uncharacterized protein (TIGR00369 family)